MARQQAQKMNRLRTFRVLKNHAPAIMSTALLQLLLRVAALAPVAVCLKGVEIPFLGEYTQVCCWIVSALFYLFGVMPIRAAGYQLLPQRELNAGRGNYKTYLGYALRRVFAGLVWGIPFVLVTGLFIYAFNGMELPQFFKILTTLGSWVGGSFDAGIVVWMAAIVLFALLFAYGWWRNTPKDYVPLHRGVRHAFMAGKTIRRRHLGAYWGYACVNMLLTLPSLLLILAIVGMDFVGGISFAGGAMAAVQGVMMKLRTPLSSSAVLYLALTFLLVHFPLCVLRKLRMSALTCRLYQNHFGSEEH